MKTDKLFLGMVGLVAWCWVTPGMVGAQAVIRSVNPPNAPLTLSVLDVANNNADITASWLPDCLNVIAAQGTCTGKTVRIQVNGASNGVALVPSPINPNFNGQTNPFLEPLATSAYPGACTNFGQREDLQTDVVVEDAGLDYITITPHDCLAMAVIQVMDATGAQVTFVVPEDRSPNGVPNGIPDLYENQHGGNLNPLDDLDPVVFNALNAVGDGYKVFDEARGIIAMGVHHRLDPNVRDVLLHKESTQCGANSVIAQFDNLPGVENPIVSLEGLNELFPFGQLHLIEATEWVQNFSRFTPSEGVEYIAGTDGGVSDRLTTQNSPFPMGQKGTRWIECVDTDFNSPLGEGGYETINGQGPLDGTAIIYSDRALRNIDTKLAAGNQHFLKTKTPLDTRKWADAPPPAGMSAADWIRFNALRFVAVHEPGHNIVLAPSVFASGEANPNFWHFADGYGTFMDFQFSCTKKGSKITCFVPGLWGSDNLNSYQLTN